MIIFLLAGILAAAQHGLAAENGEIKMMGKHLAYRLADVSST